MTTGNVLYLVMCLAMFGVFSVVLAWCSWQQATQGPEMLSDATEHSEPHGAITA